MTQQNPDYETALLRFGVGHNLLMSAQKLRELEGSEPSPENAVTIVFLMAFVTELYLKAFLLQAGVPDAELSSKLSYGHDLRALMDAANNKGLHFSQAPLMEKLVDLLNESHKRHGLRYMRPGEDVRVPVDISNSLLVLFHLGDHLWKHTDVAKLHPPKTAATSLP